MTRAKISRRIFLNSGFLAAAGIAVSGCRRTAEIEIDLAANQEFEYFEPDEGNILLDVADIMIPQTETAGATDSRSVLYLDRLMTTWAGDSTKSDIQQFIQALNQHAEIIHGAQYLELPEVMRVNILSDIDRNSFSGSEAVNIDAPYRRLKWLIFHIHYTSEAANSDFVLIPGQYRGDLSEAEYAALVEENRY